MKTRSRQLHLHRQILVDAIAMLLAAAFCAGCSPEKTMSAAPDAPTSAAAIELVDMSGARVVLARPAERIILVRGRNIHELLMLLGEEVERKLVAWGPDIESADRDAYEVFVERFPKLAETPFIGSIYRDAVNPEQLLALQPDLVLVDNFMVHRGYKSIDRMRQIGLPLLFLQSGVDPLEDATRSLFVLAKALGKEEQAAEINQFLKQQIQRVDSRLSRDAVGPSIYIEMGNRGVEQLGHTFAYDGEGRLTTWSDLADRARFDNVAKGVVTTMTPLHPEQVLKADPEVIVFTGAHWAAQPDSMRLGFRADAPLARRRLKAFTGRPGWESLRAVRSRRVYALAHDFCFHPTSVVGYQQLAKWGHPDAFADLDPNATLREFYDRFMPVELSGEWIASLKENNASLGARQFDIPISNTPTSGLAGSRRDGGGRVNAH